MDEEAKDVARRICLDLDLDLEALERAIEEYEAATAGLQGLTPEQEADFQKMLAEVGAVYHEEDNTFEFITKQ